MLRPPCYNVSTRTDCPNRSAHCRSTCPTWRQYELQKALQEVERRRQQQLRDIEYEYNKQFSQRLERRLHRK